MNNSVIAILKKLQILILDNISVGFAPNWEASRWGMAGGKEFLFASSNSDL